MKIGELAKRSGLAPSRIRFYEASGLIAQVQRQANGYREYPPQTLKLLELIASAQQTGFALEEIRALLPAADTQSWPHQALLDSLRRKVVEIDALQQRLKRNKAQLLAIIDMVENKPQDLHCAENAERVMASLGLGGSAVVPRPRAGDGGAARAAPRRASGKRAGSR